MAGKNAKKVKQTVKPTPARKIVIARPDVLHSYLKHKDVNQYLDYLANRYENFVTIHKLGVTHERRHLKAIEIDWNCEKNLKVLADERALMFGCKAVPDITLEQQSKTFANRRNIVFIEGGTHAREWMTICVALNCIYQLTEKNARNREILRKLRFFIVPVSNPDGYEYSRTKNRKWRKNRRPQTGTKYVGTDCNRNYDFHWDSGSSKSNRNTYKGEKPFSEPETRALRNILEKLAPNLLFFLSLHSYSQALMYPWGYSKDLPDNWQDLQKLAIVGRDAIKTYNGRQYNVGSIANTTKRTIPGSIVDYVFGVLKVPLALVMELPSSILGFQPSEDTISPVGHESWFGIREMCKCAFSLNPDNRQTMREGVPKFKAKGSQVTGAKLAFELQYLKNFNHSKAIVESKNNETKTEVATKN